MIKYIREIALDISGAPPRVRITAKQGDEKSRYLKITLVDGETKVVLGSGENADFRCIKPDETSCILPATKEADGSILVELDKQVLAVAGEVRADVAVSDECGKVLSSTHFFIDVEPAATNGNYIPSTSNQKMARSLDMDGHGIQNLPAPTENGDAVNKEYVDSLQSDMNVNDESDPAFIKNRTHWKEEVKAEYLTLPYLEPIPELGLAPYGRKIGLELGKTYTIEAEVAGTVYTFTATTTELPKDIFGIEVPGVVFLYQQELMLQILDGVDGDVSKGEIYTADNCYYNFSPEIAKFKIYGVETEETETVTHKLSNEFLNLDKIFNPKSENAQSGKAVKQAVDEYDESLIIGTKKLEDNSVTADKISNGAIIGEKLWNLSTKNTVVHEDDVSLIEVSGNSSYSLYRLSLKNPSNNFIKVKVVCSSGNGLVKYVSHICDYENVVIVVENVKAINQNNDARGFSIVKIGRENSISLATNTEEFYSVSFDKITLYPLDVNGNLTTFPKNYYIVEDVFQSIR